VHQQPFWVRKGHDQVAEVLKKLSRRAASLSTLEEREKLLQSSIESIPAAGPKRMQALFHLKEVLSDPEHALSEGCTQALVAFLEKELLREDLESSECEFLCRISGLSGQSRMIEPLEDLHAHTCSPEVKAAARKALRVLGLSEQEILCRKQIRSILVLEPNAFFRHRLVSILEGSERSVEVAAGRQEAEIILAEKRVDLLISESHDGLGDLWLWFTAQWQQRRLRYLLLSTSSHEPGSLAECPWVIGTLYKPYPSDDLVKAIED